jgi:hypothetical protein
MINIWASNTNNRESIQRKVCEHNFKNYFPHIWPIITFKFLIASVLIETNDNEGEVTVIKTLSFYPRIQKIDPEFMK